MSHLRPGKFQRTKKSTFSMRNKFSETTTDRARPGVKGGTDEHWEETRLARVIERLDSGPAPLGEVAIWR